MTEAPLPLDLSPEVAAALARRTGVVALESTIITHGMPYPDNVATARAVERTVRDAGAVPATIVVLGGRIRVGLTDSEIDSLGRARGVMKPRFPIPTRSRPTRSQASSTWRSPRPSCRASAARP